MSSGQQRQDDLPLLVGGISQQPAHVRVRNQVDAASNVAFSVSDGPRKRAGTTYVKKITGLTAAGNYRLHPIERDGSEKYLVVYGASVLSAYATDGTAAIVQQTADAALYLGSSSPTADNMRLITIADYTLIANTLVTVAGSTSPAFITREQHNTFEDMLTNTPAADTYHATQIDSESATTGYWQYKPGSNTYPTIVFNALASTWDAIARYSTGNDTVNGARVFMSRGQTSALTSVAWTVATKTLTKANAFTNYTWRQGDYVNVTGGTGATAEYREVASRVSANAITLVSGTGMSGSDQTDYTIDGVGEVYNMVVDFAEQAPVSLFDVARMYQKALRDAGALNACVAYTKGSTGAGRFTITGTYAGAGCTFPATFPTRTPSTPPVSSDASNDSGDPFYRGGSFVVTAGTGIPTYATASVISRWTRVPPPSQANAVPSQTTLPCKMVRIHAAGTYSTGYSGMTTDMIPTAFWRLGDALNSTTASEQGGKYPGTCTGGVTFAAAGAINGDTDTAATFDGSNDIMVAGGLGDFGSKCHRGFTVECWVKRTNSTKGVVFGAYGGNASADFISFYIEANTSDNGSSSNAGGLSVGLQATNSAGTQLITGTCAVSTLASTGTYYHLVVVVSASTSTSGIDTIAVYVNGVSKTVTLNVVTAVTSSKTRNFDTVSIGAFSGSAAATSDFLAATIDDVAVYRSVWTQSTITARYNQGINSSYSHSAIFVVSAIDWNFRETGDDSTNPLPSLFDGTHTIADIGFLRERLMLAGGENVVFSQTGDIFNFYNANFKNIVDSDPIDVPLSDERVSLIEWIMPWRNTVMIFTKAGKQFELNTPDILTPSSVAITPVSTYQTQSTRPCTMGGLLYFTTKQDNAGVYEFQYDYLKLSTRAEWVSGHVPTLLPQTIRRMAATTNTTTLFVLSDQSSGHALYAYQSYWTNDERQQSAWGSVAFTTAYRIPDMAVIGDTVYFLVEHLSQYFLESMKTAKVPTTTGWSYDIHLDRAFTLTGVHAAGTTTWTLPDSSSDTTIDCIVLGSAFGASSGTILSPTTTPGTTVTKTGDYSAGSAVLGRKFTMSLTFTRPFWRDINGTPDLGARITVRETAVVHKDSGPYTLTSVMSGRTDRTKTFTPPTGSNTQTNSTTKAFLNGNAAANAITLSSTDPRPCTISGVSVVYDSSSRAPD